MAATNAQDVLEVAVIGDFNQASEIVNVFHLKAISGVADVADVMDDIEDIAIIIFTIIKALATAQTIWRRIRVRNLSQGTILGEQAFAAPIQGTATGDSMPPGVCALTYFSTGVPHVQTRKFWGPIGETHCDGEGTLNTAARTILVNVIANMLAGYIQTNDAYSYGYLSPKTGTFLPATSGAYAEQFAYQRRRKPGRGS